MSNTLRLHSVYNPEREAQKYIDSLNLSPQIVYFILLECGLGYIIPVLRSKFPDAKLISVHIDDSYNPKLAANLNKSQSADAEWSPASPQSCTAFLEEHIADIESTKIKIIEWRPALALDAAMYKKLLTDIASVIRQIDANKRTTGIFYQRWQKNIKKNIQIFSAGMKRTLARIQQANTQNIVICAAGPGLEPELDAIVAMQKNKNCMILAVSSAVSALAARKIEPDIIFASDGGNWAAFHLYETLRLRSKPLIAAPLNAMLPSSLCNNPVILFGDGSLEQCHALKNAGLPLLNLPQRGTVTAAALDFALGWTSGKLYLAGAGLCSNDLNTHIRPYALDTFLWEKENRFLPYYHQKLTRSRELEAGQSYKIYADWFKTHAAEWQPRIFSLGNNNSAFPFPAFVL